MLVRRYTSVRKNQLVEERRLIHIEDIREVGPGPALKHAARFHVTRPRRHSHAVVLRRAHSTFVSVFKYYAALCHGANREAFCGSSVAPLGCRVGASLLGDTARAYKL